MKNEIKILSDKEAIVLVSSPKYGTQEVLIDTEDIEVLSKYRWNVKAGPHSLYYVHTSLGSRNTGKWSMTMHRLLMGHPDRGLVVDHIDGNCMNNKKSNLRVTSYANNRRNSAKQVNTKCRYRGVYERNDYKGKYRAQLRFEGKIYNLGTFTDMILAAKTYDEFARKCYGEFAVTNFPT